MDMLRAVLLAYIIWCPALGQTYKISVIVGGQPVMYQGLLVDRAGNVFRLESR